MAGKNLISICQWGKEAPPVSGNIFQYYNVYFHFGKLKAKLPGPVYQNKDTSSIGGVSGMKATDKGTTSMTGFAGSPYDYIGVVFGGLIGGHYSVVISAGEMSCVFSSKSGISYNFNSMIRVNFDCSVDFNPDTHEASTGSVTTRNWFCEYDITESALEFSPLPFFTLERI